MFDTGRVEQGERRRVQIDNWPSDRGPGGWVVPYGHPTIVWWVVTRVHARYVAPPRRQLRWDAVLREEVEVVTQRFPLRAYLVDLETAALPPELALEPLERVLLHQRPPEYWWWLRHVTEQELAGMEQYRQA
ncbi:hypothetical protein ACGFJC_47760 [Nonomuraea fuscirosea]|uniref:hypothetical protein n=1 Tax=Nonomuraea fuscirosea TaxID=1291556 RepID=UPI00371AA211